MKPTTQVAYEALFRKPCQLPVGAIAESLLKRGAWKRGLQYVGEPVRQAGNIQAETGWQKQQTQRNRREKEVGEELGISIVGTSVSQAS